MPFTTRITIASLLTGALAGCVVAPPSMGDLKAAREACNRDYPARLGNYLPHARCVNAAIESYALPTARHPDLIRLQAEIRASLSEKIDHRRLSVQAGERRMAEADRLVAAAQHDREAGNEKAASRRIAPHNVAPSNSPLAKGNTGSRFRSWARHSSRNGFSAKARRSTPTPTTRRNGASGGRCDIQPDMTSRIAPPGGSISR